MDSNENKNKKFKVYHGDSAEDILNRLIPVLATFGLEVVQTEKEDFYVEHEIKALR